MFSKILNHQQRQQLSLVTSIVDILHGYFLTKALFVLVHVKLKLKTLKLTHHSDKRHDQRSQLAIYKFWKFNWNFRLKIKKSIFHIEWPGVNSMSKDCWEFHATRERFFHSIRLKIAGMWGSFKVSFFYIVSLQHSQCKCFSARKFYYTPARALLTPQFD